MDEPTFPTAEELGVSEIEYERILRGMRERNLGGEDVVIASELSRVRVPDSPQGLFDSPAADAAVRKRPSRWLVAGVAAVIAVSVLSRTGGGGSSRPAYAFLDSVNGHPVTYSSCKPIQVAVYPANGPSDAVQLVKEAVAQMRSATGLDLRVIGGFGGHAPNWNFEAAPIRPDDPVAVSWQDGDAIRELTDDIAGLGGSFVIDGSGGSRHLASGTIALSRDYYAHLAEIGDHAEAVAVLLHEFGHVLGLGHVNSAGELMYEKNIGRTTLGPGDLEGLRLAGQGPCV